ncbi:DUF1559 domain-containing protein [Rhodopirellula halodulae]|uniref:DUF1559 domain-containing protein n=1 Tax=Rhodopirellula halodulae TaxID=2894198 RepID=UPI001E5CCE26|nr:DUF1559 domain-containing protein [Rhodopirellula sp. JC737]MCC9654492.1 DUF1559 domain-containing protein [Rhodopirellula sp. JC737]
MQRKPDRAEPSRAAFTILELLVVVTIAAILFGLLMPAVRTSSGAARRMGCSNNFKHLGLAMHNYHSSYNQLPAMQGGTGPQGNEMESNLRRLSGLVALLPFLEQAELWENITEASTIEGEFYPSMGPAPWVKSYSPWRTQVPSFQCPASPATAEPFGLTSYAFCVGDQVDRLNDDHESTRTVRGVFAGRFTTKFRDIKDGLSNTIAMAEIGNDLGDRYAIGQTLLGQSIDMFESPESCRVATDPDRPGFYSQESTLASVGRGGRWADGAAAISAVATILPPNSASCSVGLRLTDDAILSVGSFHQHGAHFLMCDGAVRFVTDTIDHEEGLPPVIRVAEDESSLSESTQLESDAWLPVSPYGLWGALGTARSGEAEDAP